MYDWFSTLISVGLYVLQALGLYTIAKRRGIARPWLAWVPVGSVWIMGSIADDFKARQGKKTSLRIWLVILAAAILLLTVGIVVSTVTMLTRVLTANELLDVVINASAMGNDLYAPTEEEMITQLAEILEQRLTDQILESTIRDAVLILLASLAVGVVGIVAMVLECICLYRVYDSCNPSTKTVFLLLSIFLSLGGVFLFVNRNKDLGLPRGIPASYEPVE